MNLRQNRGEVKLAVPLLLALFWAGAASAQSLSPSNVDCTATPAVDADADGLSDACELALAIRFAPILVVRPGGCNWEADHQVLRGGYMFAVQRVDSVVRIAYMPAYFRDCGWHGAKCWLPGVDCSPHDGDSEFIAIELKRAPPAGAWRAGRIFLSAHCFGHSGASCRWFGPDELQRFGWRGDHPVVWVAEGRQANYPSASACDAGHHSLDTCDRNGFNYPFPIRSASQNIGSASRPTRASRCIGAAELPGEGTSPGAAECFWDPEMRFRGWQGEGEGATGYFRYLSEVVQFATAGQAPSPRGIP